MTVEGAQGAALPRGPHAYLAAPAGRGRCKHRGPGCTEDGRRRKRHLVPAIFTAAGDEHGKPRREDEHGEPARNISPGGVPSRLRRTPCRVPGAERSLTSA